MDATSSEEEKEEEERKRIKEASLHKVYKVGHLVANLSVVCLGRDVVEQVEILKIPSARFFFGVI